MIRIDLKVAVKIAEENAKKIVSQRLNVDGPIASPSGTVNLFFPLFYGTLDVKRHLLSQHTTPYSLAKSLKEDIEHFVEQGKHTKLSFDIFQIKMSERTNKDKFYEVLALLKECITK